MTHDMIYDGQVLRWTGHGSFRASSGLPGFQAPGESCRAESGPVPPGLYQLYLADQDWGSKRARLEPADAATRNRCAPARGGFYLHDSTKGYSHGCIGVEGRIFPLLRTYARGSRSATMIIKVEYVNDRAADGGTLVE
ncbi:DUF2778 domain-containing protein [Bordetella petrii]|nr:DUF2778 domain-containing protein [Bordetella petrii]